MSAQFEVGQQVAGDDYDRLPVGTEVQIEPYEVGFIKTRNGWLLGGDPRHPMSVHDRHMTRFIAALPVPVDHLPDATEPEDKDDLHVEPEPLKEGDWCLVWGQVDKVESPAGSFVSIGRSGERRYFAANAIVRPDAGQVPPWVKPVRCTSLLRMSDGFIVVQCEGPTGHQHERDIPKDHEAGEWIWTDAEAYGRVEVSS